MLQKSRSGFVSLVATLMIAALLLAETYGGNARLPYRRRPPVVIKRQRVLIVGGGSSGWMAAAYLVIGYFTKFGDGASDILPIVSLYKTQVRGLARYLGVPESIILKKSSPNLWLGHNAEEEIGAQYDGIDLILYCIIDKKFSIEDTVKITNIDKPTVDKIYQLYKTNEHKRITAARL